MKQYCIHCGQPIELDTASAGATATCPSCGKTTSALTPQGAPAAVPPRQSRLKDAAIILGAVLLLLLLLLLFLRPDHPARRWVFGDWDSSDNRTTPAATVPPGNLQSDSAASSRLSSRITT